jgi:hypothetical protein
MLTVTLSDINVSSPIAGPLVYINETLITSATSSLLRFEAGPAMKLMDRFTGDFDGLKIFDTNLTGDEVRDLYLQTKQLYPSKVESTVVPDGLERV